MKTVSFIYFVSPCYEIMFFEVQNIIPYTNKTNQMRNKNTRRWAKGNSPTKIDNTRRKKFLLVKKKVFFKGKTTNKST